MVNVAVLGFGVVGSGVVEVMDKNGSSIEKKAGQEIRVKRIVDIRDFSGSPYGHLVTPNIDDVINDEDIQVVVETIGGARIAYEFTKRALHAGKHVVTSNKELVATHGPELLALAREKGVNYLFEASVGGGIPIIRPLNQCLAANEIHRVAGILNGTTNYILTQMKNGGKDFAEALKGAQQNGYAEADPTADIEGHDACRKIAILSSIAYNQYVDYKKILTEGISKISTADMENADELDCVIKLIGMSRRNGDSITARVGPTMIRRQHPLANVDDVYNAIVVDGDAIGEAMFYGRGAGKLPTASAVVADIIDITKHSGTTTCNIWTIPEVDPMVDPLEEETRLYVRLKVRNPEEARKLVHKTFGQVRWIKPAEGREDELAFVTERGIEKQIRLGLEQFKGTGSIRETANVIRLMEE